MKENINKNEKAVTWIGVLFIIAVLFAALSVVSSFFNIWTAAGNVSYMDAIGADTGSAASHLVEAIVKFIVIGALMAAAIVFFFLNKKNEKKVFGIIYRACILAIFAYLFFESFVGWISSIASWFGSYGNPYGAKDAGYFFTLSVQSLWILLEKTLFTVCALVPFLDFLGVFDKKQKQVEAKEETEKAVEAEVVEEENKAE